MLYIRDGKKRRLGVLSGIDASEAAQGQLNGTLQKFTLIFPATEPLYREHLEGFQPLCALRG
jgi:hypothetical protein